MMAAVTPYNDPQRGKKAQVEEMFDNIALTYDFLNRLLSIGIDKSWRKKAVDYIGEIKPQYILDLATGTGDFAMESLRLQPVQIIAGDIAEKMMEVGRQKAAVLQAANKLIFQQIDAENMPFADNKFDAITVGFGVRNFENLEKGLAEMHRVLRAGGRAAVLEVSQPVSFPMRQLFGCYFRAVLPLVGRLFSRDARAYSYLPESVKVFPDREKFVAILEQTGFVNCRYQSLTFGICAFYTCEKASS